ncbi:MAG: glycosyltransferase [Candidatus Colwellbacteria bacterium]|nr:glycosyltransferase [Candidatus Colwellbacteria bacterium]
MRIGIFTEVYKPVINGVVNSIVGFKKGLEEQGNEVFVFCPTYEGYKDDPSDKNIVHMKSIPLPGASGYHYIFRADKRIIKIAETMDVIHVHHPFIMGGIAAGIAKKLNKPLVFTNHTQYEQYAHYVPAPGGIVKYSIKKRIKNFMKNVDLVVAPAKGIIPVLREYGVDGEINIVPNGIDIDRFKREVPTPELEKLIEKHKLKHKDKILIYTGRIAEEKNLTFLLKSFAKLAEKNANIHLMMVGGGPQMKEFVDLIDKMRLGSRVTITDYVPYQEMQNYLALADVYVTASKSEVHPLTIIEGMAAGLPMVVIDAPGTGDVVTDNVDGLIAKDELDDFVAKIERVLGDNALREKLARQAVISAEKYSFRETSKSMLNAYKEAIVIHNKRRSK